jgi:hypothetical protein
LTSSSEALYPSTSVFALEAALGFRKAVNPLNALLKGLKLSSPEELLLKIVGLSNSEVLEDRAPLALSIINGKMDIELFHENR